LDSFSAVINVSVRQVSVSHALARFLGTGQTINQPVNGLSEIVYSYSYVKKLNIPSIYFIHCHLIDKNKNFLNGKRSDVLARFDTKGRPYEKINYSSPPTLTYVHVFHILFTI